VIAAFLAATVCLMPVHDGDGIKTCAGEKIRIAGIDAPEVRGSPRCSAKQRRRLAGSKNPPWCDYAKGEQARQKLSAFLLSGPVKIHRVGNGGFGRTLAYVSVGGRDAGQYLRSLGLARRWNQ
jgi:micrococcal nuclease